MIKAIIFDADGVVIDTSPIYANADKVFLNNHGIIYDYKELEHQLTGLSLENGVEIMKNLFGITGDSKALLQERVDIIKTLYKQISFIPGFLDFYNQIKFKYKTAIATSSHVEIFSIAEDCLGLHKLFDNHIYFLKDVNNISKPAPDIYLYAAKQLGVSPSDCLVVEDAPNGIKAGKSAGMKCLGLATTHNASLLKDADQIVSYYTEINLNQF